MENGSHNMVTCHADGWPEQSTSKSTPITVIRKYSAMGKLGSELEM